MGWFILALIVGWLCGRNWDSIVSTFNANKHKIGKAPGSHSDNQND